MTRVNKISVIVFIYNSYKDPLFQNLILNYLISLTKKSKNKYRFDIITFEQKEFKMTQAEIIAEREKLSGLGIHWYPKHYHSGRFIMLKKAIDLAGALLTVTSLKLRYRTRYILAFANVAAAFSVLCSKILGLQLIIYSYEPHSLFMSEVGIWNKKNMNFRVLSYLEKLAGKYASHIMTGTKYGIDYLQELGTCAKTYRAPTAVDPTKFYFNLVARQKIRDSMGLGNKKLVVYFGKFGGLYYSEEIITVFAALYANRPDCYFLVATNFDHLQIKSWFESNRVPSSNYTIRPFIPIEDMSTYLSAADLGMVAIPPTPSQKYRSPTKVAEYLLCGLPFVICHNISEDHHYAQEFKLGVVLENFSKEECADKIESINELLDEDRLHFSKRSRAIGLEYRSKKHIEDILQKILE